MITCKTLIHELQSGAYDEPLSRLYALDGAQKSLDMAQDRIHQAVLKFMDLFSHTVNTPVALFSGPGRTEIGGNHTDHQHGHVLCASVDMDMLACAAPNGLDVIRIQSEGYPALEVDLKDLPQKAKEVNTSSALVRGMAAGIVQLGYTVSGFDACVTSNVLSGSGLSSSAAYEVLIGNIINHFSCKDTLDAVQIAKIGQYAENAYFGKPCGLMDQMGSSIGGAVAIDFQNPKNPIMERVDYDFTKSGHTLCIVDSGSCHADLTDDYAAITQEMGSIAAYFGKSVLREVPEADFRSAIQTLRVICGDRAVLRAMHYYEDDRRAIQEAQALKAGDFETFLSLVNASGRSSTALLQNTWSIANPKQQAVPLALAEGERLLEGTGAIRVHGGGFAGTVQAFVPNERVGAFKAGMESLLGPGKCHILHIRSQGGCVVAE